MEPNHLCGMGRVGSKSMVGKSKAEIHVPALYQWFPAAHWGTLMPQRQLSQHACFLPILMATLPQSPVDQQALCAGCATGWCSGTVEVWQVGKVAVCYQFSARKTFSPAMTDRLSKHCPMPASLAPDSTGKGFRETFCPGSLQKQLTH